MISLVMPYWDRRAAADASLALMARHYAGLDLEIVLVDDGTPERYTAPAGLPWPVTVIRLPEKGGPLNPCVPFNRGVAAAKGDVIGITNPENLHVEPVLPDLLAELARGGESAYVLAACWHVEGKAWHCHSRLAGLEVAGVRLPKGAHYHFLGLMHRSLWERAGGFDEDYRDGAGYDDPDLVLRLARAGARFVIRDDLVVHHVRTRARAAWTPAMWARNKQLFQGKWNRA